MGKDGVYCEICLMWLNGSTQWEDHLIGKKHKKNCKQQGTGMPRCHRRHRRSSQQYAGFEHPPMMPPPPMMMPPPQMMPPQPMSSLFATWPSLDGSMSAPVNPLAYNVGDAQDQRWSPFQVQ